MAHDQQTHTRALGGPISPPEGHRRRKGRRFGGTRSRMRWVIAGAVLALVSLVAPAPSALAQGRDVVASPGIIASVGGPSTVGLVIRLACEWSPSTECPARYPSSTSWPCYPWQIKANWNSSIYHLPRQRHYAATYANTWCFGFEADALEHGFRPARS